MTTVPPRHYCVIENPVVRDDNGKVIMDENGEAKLAFADLEMRFSGEPFPLYPGEIMKEQIKALEIIAANTALKLVAKLDFNENNGIKRIAGDEWLIEGPCSYIPRKEVDIIEKIKAFVIKPNQGLKLKAMRDFTDKNNNKRVTGEEWIENKCGAYIPSAYEEVVDTVHAQVLTEKVSFSSQIIYILSLKFSALESITYSSFTFIYR
jgi:major vault protein